MDIRITSNQAFRRGIAPLFAILTPHQIGQLSAWQGDPVLEARVSELGTKANEGELAEAEQGEYIGYIEANDLLAVLQAAARYFLSSVG